MPSHKSIVGIRSAVDSTGQPITTLMWRANRLVDGLAKMAAGRHRLPEWALQRLAAAAQLVKHAAAQLGVVTHRANNHQVTHLVDGGVTVTRVCRDSSAERQRPRFFKVRLPASSTKTSDSNGPAQSTSSIAPAPLGAGSRSARGTKRCRPPEPTASTVSRRKTLAAKQQWQLHQDLQEQEQIARCIASRELAVRSGPTAQERIERLRQRLRSKQP